MTYVKEILELLNEVLRSVCDRGIMRGVVFRFGNSHEFCERVSVFVFEQIADLFEALDGSVGAVECQRVNNVDNVLIQILG